MTETEATPKKSNPLARLALRVAIYLAIIVLLLYVRGRSALAPANGPLPTIENLADAPPPTSPDHQGKQDIQPLMSAYYPRRTFLAWDVEKNKEGRQIVSVLLKLEGNLKDLNWNELKLRSKDHPADLATPQPPTSMPEPVPGIVLIKFNLPADAPDYAEGLVWCWNQAFCELTKDRRWPKAELEKYLKENEVGATDNPARPG